MIKASFWVPVSSIAFLLAGVHAAAAATSPVYTGIKSEEVVKRPGNYKSADGLCSISLTTSDKGGFLRLGFQGARARLVNDVTGVGYLTSNLVIYTVSPIYGRPGVYSYDCRSHRSKRIVSPRTKNEAYPDGADFFELKSLGKRVIYFYFAPDVDSVDFATFRIDSFLYEVRPDGSGFRQTKQ